ncbi:MAG: EamA family transporter [Acidimicrobiales bacterium mtb01]|nr:DMT family transporter [Actinomycetota bacterium]TEX47342.1 MAG: EamA family transporter [Acidimicrobiales bacterium mtb01]
MLLWSTGFIVARYATRDAGPLSFLFLRMVAAAVILWLVATATNAPKLSRSDTRWAATAGLGLHAVYLGGVFIAASWGLPSGLSALIAGLHPVVTSVGALVILRERLSGMKWVGVGLGVGGVVAVVIDRLEAGVSGITAGAIVAMILSVLGMASGTLVQRAKGGSMPLLRGTAVQYASAAIALGIGSVVHEGFDVRLTARFWWSLLWAVGVLSIAAVLIMLWLLQRRATVRVSSLFFLTPALSTVEGAVLFDERLGGLAVAGLGVALVGVFLTTRP